MMEEQPPRRGRWRFWTAFALFTIALAIFGYFVVWAEIDRIRELIPVENRDDTDNCYKNPLLNLQIWTKKGHFHPLYEMQEVVDYATCLETSEALHEAQIFYVSYYFIGLALVMIFIVFLLVITGTRWKTGLLIVAVPILFGAGEAAFIFYLLGCYISDDIGGLDEILCQICGAVGLIFWVLFGFVLLYLIFSYIEKCGKLCSNDRQKGVFALSVRDIDGTHTIYGNPTYEMMKKSGDNETNELAKTGLF